MKDCSFFAAVHRKKCDGCLPSKQNWRIQGWLSNNRSCKCFNRIGENTVCFQGMASQNAFIRIRWGITLTAWYQMSLRKFDWQSNKDHENDSLSSQRLHSSHRFLSSALDISCESHYFSKVLLGTISDIFQSCCTRKSWKKQEKVEPRDASKCNSVFGHAASLLHFTKQLLMVTDSLAVCGPACPDLFHHFECPQCEVDFLSPYKDLWLWRSAAFFKTSATTSHLSSKQSKPIKCWHIGPDKIFRIPQRSYHALEFRA